MAGLSVVLITRNEEENIDRCLQSVRWADEIIVVDSFSTDRTVEKARAYTEKVYQHEYPGSSKQGERGIGYASGEWILLLDADEVVSSELAAEIQAMLDAETPFTAYRICRKPMMFGRWIEHGGWFPDYQVRLFRKDRRRAEHQEVHGGFTTDGPHGTMQGFVYHYTYDTVYDYVERMNDYTSLEISNRLRRDPAVQVRRSDLLLHPLSHFLRMYISRKGYRDGFHGFVLSLLDANYSMLLYAKLWEYQAAKKAGREPLPPVNNATLNARKRHR